MHLTSSHDYGGGGVGSGSLGLCLWAKISTGLWMVCSNFIKNIYLLAVKMICKKEMDGEFSPVLAIATSLDRGGGYVDESGLGLCLWVKISSGLWMVHSNSIKK